MKTDEKTLDIEFAHLPYVIGAEWRIYATVNEGIIASDNGLAPGQRQAITWTNAGFLSIGLLRTHFSENRIGILSFSLKKLHLKLSSAKMAAILSRGTWVNRICAFKTWLYYTVASDKA